MDVIITKKGTGYFLVITNGESSKPSTNFYSDLIKLSEALWLHLSQNNLVIKSELLPQLESSPIMNGTQLASYLNAKFVRRLPAAGLRHIIPNAFIVLRDHTTVSKNHFIR